MSLYPQLIASFETLSKASKTAALRRLCQTDLFFLLVYALKRKDANRQWLFERCREVQANPDGYLDLWAREHYKSTIITFALTIQDVLNDPEVTVGIFSHTRPIAKGFLRQIKRELESNELLKELFDDILWQDPQKEAPKWSEDDGLIVKRKTNPKESTIEAWGIVDGQPTSKHFKLMVYDDVVTKDSVSGPDMIKKVTEHWELSTNLGMDGGHTRYIGTRYHLNDTYREIMGRGAGKPRLFPVTENGQVDGKPVLLTPEAVAKKRREMGPYTFACQLLQDPQADATQGFKEDWMRYSAEAPDGDGMNRYLIVDPASAKKKDSDYTAAWVIGLASDLNIYVLDMVRDRLNLTERANMLFSLHRRWKPHGVGYEKYGMQADIEHMKDRMERENYHFSITELGGSMAKVDRIRRLIPLFEQGRIWMLSTLLKANYEGKIVDLVQSFLADEYRPFPVGAHDDMLDSLARIEDEAMFKSWPMAVEPREPDRYARPRYGAKSKSAWAA